MNKVHVVHSTGSGAVRLPITSLPPIPVRSGKGAGAKLTDEVIFEKDLED